MHNESFNTNEIAASSELISMADQIRSLCSVITKIARSDLQSRLESRDAGISAIEHGLLRHLSGGVATMAEIRRLMGVAPSTLVYVVDGLVKKRLVTRGKDPADRRREPLQIEKKAIDLLARIPKMDASSVLVKSLEGMKESQRRGLLLLLNQFAGGLPGSERMYLRAEAQETGASASAVRRLAARGRK
ncbi:MAG TPA: helix-turn-helix domain-containing protein [Gemmataceae bacterium]|nr:helix-turn-helix domain-containing protein [Gemmataceae bacterium]